MYAGLVTVAGIASSPRAAWLLLRVGQHPGMGRHDLAQLLQLTDAELERRLTELVAIGYVQVLRPDPDQPVPLSEAGQDAFDALFQARHERIAQYVGDWHPSQHPGLVALLDRLTHQLAAGGESPGRDLDPEPAASAAPGSG